MCQARQIRPGQATEKKWQFYVRFVVALLLVASIKAMDQGGIGKPFLINF